VPAEVVAEPRDVAPAVLPEVVPSAKHEPEPRPFGKTLVRLAFSPLRAAVRGILHNFFRLGFCIDGGLERLAEGMAGEDHRILHNFFRLGFCAVAVGVMTLLWLGPNRDETAVGRVSNVSNPSSAGAGPPAASAVPAPPPAPDGLKTRPTELSVDLGGDVTMEFVLIAAGKFMMGDESGTSDEKPVHCIMLTKPFYLGKYEVTQAQWEAVMRNNPSDFKGDLQRPVEQVSWNDAVAFCDRLSQKEKRTYRLPTEAEWEYACRAGSTSKWSFGDSESELGDYAWYGSNSSSRTHPVGGKKPNAWGLFDIHGNVSEWCADWYGDGYYGSSPRDDPTGPSSGVNRVLRGGCWLSDVRDARSSDRDRGRSTGRSPLNGFRAARTLNSEPNSGRSIR
jgi:formylglycine-generating enzyme required for sulfatase activity